MRLDFYEAVDDLIRSQDDARLRATMQEGFRLQDERIEDRKKKDQEARIDAGEIAVIAAAAGVSSADIIRLNDRMSLHHQAVIEALQENRELLDASQKRLDGLLDQAYVLEDGRRVFRTEDGLRVFDEHGAELSADEVDPGAIEDWRPTAEIYAAEKERFVSLQKEQQALFDYQEQLDQAQTLIDGGTLSEEEFSEIEALLSDDVPDAVKRRLPQSEPAALSPNGSNVPPNALAAPAFKDPDASTEFQL